MRKVFDSKKISEYGIFVVLLIVFIAFSLATPQFLKKANITNIMRQVSMVGIASTGFIFVLLLGGIDLSIGAQITMSNIIMGYLINETALDDLTLIFCIGILFHLVCGLLNGSLVVWLKIPPLIVTLSTMTIWQGAAYLVCRGRPYFGFPENVKTIGQGSIGSIPISFMIMAVMFLLCWIILNRSYFGRYFYAVGGNPDASRLSGINIDGINIMAYLLSAFAAAIAGIVILSRTNSAQPSAGDGFEFDVITAAVLGGVSTIGGKGKVLGMLAGVIIIGILNNGLVLISMDAYAQKVVKGIVLIMAVGYDCYSNSRAAKKKMVIKNVEDAEAAA